MLKQKIFTSIRKVTAQSDYTRWKHMSSLSPNWDSRTKLIADSIDPGSTVLEFGAGRMYLKTCLPDHCTYIPSDLVDRGDSTFVCDLNKKKLPEFPHHDIAVFSGVLEYINNIPRLIKHLHNYGEKIITSYAITDSNKADRRRHGWVNDYSDATLTQLFTKSGYSIESKETWGDQKIYKIIKKY